MKSDMVKSQYDIMEIPKDEELLQNGGDAITVDTSGKSPEEIFKEIIGTDNILLKNWKKKKKRIAYKGLYMFVKYVKALEIHWFLHSLSHIDKTI